MTEAMPMPRPPITRHTSRSGTENARPEPTELTMNMTEPSSMTRRRPQLSASRPAYQAPTAQPRSAIETTKPLRKSPRRKWEPRASTAPLMTEESKPKRKPPTAAAIETPSAFPL